MFLLNKKMVIGKNSANARFSARLTFAKPRFYCTFFYHIGFFYRQKIPFPPNLKEFELRAIIELGKN